MLVEGYTILGGTKLSVQLGGEGSVLCRSYSQEYDATKKSKETYRAESPTSRASHWGRGIGRQGRTVVSRISQWVDTGRVVFGRTYLLTGSKIFAFGAYALVVVDILQD